MTRDSDNHGVDFTSEEAAFDELLARHGDEIEAAITAWIHDIGEFDADGDAILEVRDAVQPDDASSEYRTTLLYVVQSVLNDMTEDGRIVCRDDTRIYVLPAGQP